MYERYLPALYLAIPATFLVLSLATGKAMNPLRGTRPFIVHRSKQPVHYWSSVVFTAIITGFAAWIAYEIYATPL